jgi:hypothetical protein
MKNNNWIRGTSIDTRDTKVLVRAMGQFFFNSLKNAKEWFLRIWIMLNDRDPDKNEIYIECPKIKYEDN